MRPISQSYINSSPAPQQVMAKTPLQKSEDTKAAAIQKMLESGSYRVDITKVASKVASSLM